MRQHRPRSEEPAPIDQFGRSQTVRGDAVVDLSTGLGQVDVHAEVALGHRTPDPFERRRAHRVHRVRAQERFDPIAELGDPIQRLDRVVLQSSQSGGVTLVDEWRADHATKPGVFDGTGRFGSVPVHVEQLRRSRTDHLQTREPRTPVHVVGLQSTFCGPDTGLEPSHQGQVVTEAAEQGHRGMGVPVHQAGKQRAAAAVDHLVALARYDIGPDGLDRRAGAQPDAHTVERHVRNGQCHATLIRRQRSLTFTTRLPAVERPVVDRTRVGHGCSTHPTRTRPGSTPHHRDHSPCCRSCTRPRTRDRIPWRERTRSPRSSPRCRRRSPGTGSPPASRIAGRWSARTSRHRGSASTTRRAMRRGLAPAMQRRIQGSCARECRRIARAWPTERRSRRVVPPCPLANHDADSPSTQRPAHARTRAARAQPGWRRGSPDARAGSDPLRAARAPPAGRCRAR